MASPFYKRKAAGPTVAELRKTGVGREVGTVKKPPHKVERNYTLTTTVTTLRRHTETQHFKTRGQMEAARMEHEKKHRVFMQGMRMQDGYRRLYYRFAWGDPVESKIEFTEAYE